MSNVLDYIINQPYNRYEEQHVSINQKPDIRWLKEDADITIEKDMITILRISFLQSSIC